MKVTDQRVVGVKLIEPSVFGDHRGFFLENYQEQRYREHGIDASFVQDNVSKSSQNVLRGLHLQHPFGQGKLVSVMVGTVLDVAVDLRRGSPSFGKWVAAELSGDNHRQLYVPPGCAHGFCVLSEEALFTYKCTELYHRETEISVAYNDPELGIEWPKRPWTLSEKDAEAPRLKDIPAESLPSFDR